MKKWFMVITVLILMAMAVDVYTQRDAKTEVYQPSAEGATLTLTRNLIPNDGIMYGGDGWWYTYRPMVF